MQHDKNVETTLQFDHYVLPVNLNHIHMNNMYNSLLGFCTHKTWYSHQNPLHICCTVAGRGPYNYVHSAHY